MGTVQNADIAQTVLGCFAAVAFLAMCINFVWDVATDCFRGDGKDYD